MILVNELSDAISEELTIYSESVIKDIKKEAQKSIRQLVKDTKATAPMGKRSHHYKDSISSKKIEETDRAVKYAWYVKGPDYRLSHLLENGHATKNGGRVSGTHFIKNASEPILKDYEKKIEEVLKK